jgi:hypothetical protein
MNSTASRWRTWCVPVVLALLTTSGLLSALLGEHLAWKMFAWVALSAPTAMAIWYSCRRR